MSAVLILTTTGSQDEAVAIAETLIAERLAACVQLSPIESWYRWEGKVARADEVRLHVKTSAALAEKAAARIRALHSYALPEIVTLPVDGSADYLAWIAASAGPEDQASPS